MRLLWSLMALMLLVALLAYYLLFTQSGSQRVIDYAISHYQWPISYQSMTGHLGDSLQLEGLNFHSPEMHVEVAQFSYRMDWSLWQRTVNFSALNLTEVVIKSNPSPTPTPTNEPNAEDLLLPFDVHIQRLLIDGLQYEQGDQVHALEQLSAQVSWQANQIEINPLQIKHPAAELTLAGRLESSSDWPFDLSAEWRWQDPADPSRVITGTGPFTGQVAGINLHQRIELNDAMVQGVVLVDAAMEFDAGLNIDVDFESEHALDLDTATGPIQAIIQPSNWHLNGTTQRLDLTAELTSDEWPAGQMSLQASGDIQSAIGGQLLWRTQAPAKSSDPDTEQMEARFELDLSSGLALNSQWQLQRFNPAAWGLAAPGHIDGQLQWIGSWQANRWELALLDSELSGTLFDQPLQVTGGGRISQQAVHAEQLTVLLGDNRLQLNGDMSPQSMDLSIHLAATDLAHFDQGLDGDISGQISISGAYEQPAFKAQLQAQLLQHEDLILQGVELSGTGIWNDTVDAQLSVSTGQFKQVDFSQLMLTWQGWVASHQLAVSVQMDEFSTELALQGAYRDDAGSPGWQGTLSNHVLLLNDGQAIRLTEPAEINWGDGLSLSTLCWTGVAEGQLCIQSDHIKANQSLTGSLQVSQFSVKPFQALLPDPMTISGHINGTAGFVFNQDDIKLDAQLALNAGHIKVQGEQSLLLDQRINELTLTAQNSGNQVKGQLQLQLADDSRLHWEGVLSRADQQAEWGIESNLTGQLTNPEFIKEISSEISEIEGLIELSGEVSGLLSGPRVSVSLKQDQGFLKLTRMGTRIEQLQLTINSHTDLTKVYELNLSGRHLLSNEQGRLNLQGSLDINQPWVFKGQLTGQQFRVINLPELSLDISPELRVEASEQSATITGQVDLPYGHVVIKSLPPEAINNSNDLVVIRDEPDDSNSTGTYPVMLDVRARITDVLKLDVIGLQANLTGALQIKQGASQQPQGHGELSLQEGTYQIYGQKLNIETGDLYFSGPLDNPRLNIIASRKATVDAVKAGVKLGGTVDNLQSELFSEPAMTDVEKLAYIMTGQGINAGGELDSESLKQTAILLGLSQSSPIFNQIQQQFGIDVLTVKRNGPKSESVIEAGKQISDRLYVSYNQGLFNRLGFWVLKYRINQYLNLQSTQGEDQSVELVYTRKAAIKKPKVPLPEQ